MFYINFSTTKGNFLDGGTTSDHVFMEKVPDGYQLGGFVSYTGEALTMVSAIWTSIDPISALPTTSGGT
ncbi:hypothetical protein PsorP6_010843 [Peronosclerospora sorghi]|uniref:Uncharacterized protein n=1 Tax=Peronosclerospora sorghi TaxID=230839 RepID=A0ACC0VVY6_9STRA|nr:hypothetical protein PsorP6_010843 [Peronosclerospora sorghi]